jgi:hypothetical protein
VTFLVYSCGESGKNETIISIADAPRIADFAFCKSIRDGKPDRMRGPGTFFWEDDVIYIWIYWANVESTSTVKVVWYNESDNKLFHEDSQAIDTKNGFGITWFELGWENRPEECRVEIYLDGEFQRSYLFEIAHRYY